MPLPGRSQGVHGGACAAPISADIHVRLDAWGGPSPRIWPWTPGVEVFFPVPDFAAPKDLDAFRAMISWLDLMITAGHSVHVGCGAGHGRTGLVLSALVRACGERDAIRYVRAHYCPEAVETKCQVDFLVEHFNVLRAVPSVEATQ